MNTLKLLEKLISLFTICDSSGNPVLEHIKYTANAQKPIFILV